MPSNKKLKKILNADKLWYIRLADVYLRRPTLWDFIIGLSIVGVNFIVVKYIGYILMYEKTAIADTLNELISSTLSSGGFILAALAILASIKQNIHNEKQENKGREYFFSGSGYKRIINIYSFACLVFLFLFILFTILRSGVDHFPLDLTSNLLIIGITILVLSFLRCIIILWILIKN